MPRWESCRSWFPCQMLRGSSFASVAPALPRTHGQTSPAPGTSGPGIRSHRARRSRQYGSRNEPGFPPGCWLKPPQQGHEHAVRDQVEHVQVGRVAAHDMTACQKLGRPGYFTVLSSVLRMMSGASIPGSRETAGGGCRTAPASARVRRRRAVVATVAVAVVAVVVWFAILPHGGTSTHGTARPPVRAGAVPPVLDAAESGLLPWHLAAPLSREVVVPGSPGELIVLGGLTRAGTSASGVYVVRTATERPGRSARSAPRCTGRHDLRVRRAGHQCAGLPGGGERYPGGGPGPARRRSTALSRAGRRAKAKTGRHESLWCRLSGRRCALHVSFIKQRFMLAS